MRRRAPLIVSALALACGGRQPSSPGFADPSDDPGSNGSDRTVLYSRAVDLLVVVDNSATMGRAQAQLASELGGVLERLEASDIDYRVAVTTTDNGNPWCPAGVTTPEGGKFVASACSERLDEFIDLDRGIDVRDQACKDLCDRAELGLLPSTTSTDPEPKQRPWIDGAREGGNLPPELSGSEAVACMLPQGILGCAFGSPLESAYLALNRSLSDDEPQYGFLREWATTAVLFVTNKVDCSYDKNWAEIFDQDGNHAFWSDPQAQFPTRALCWNAGVACEGDPSGYDGCEPVDYDVDAVPTDDPSAAVLYPMARYLELLRGLEEEHRSLNYDAELLVAVIAGYAEDGGLVYADASDPEVQDRLGIGPGCLEPDGNEVPPLVRLRALDDEFPELGPSSICADSYAPMLEQLAEQIIAQAPQRCVSLCPWDADKTTEIVDPQCRVELRAPGSDEVVLLPECERDEDGAYLIDATGEHVVPADEPGCYAALVDRAGLTPSTADDLSDECREAGNYFELRVETVAPQAYSLVEIGCIESRFPEVYCPQLSTR